MDLAPAARGMVGGTVGGKMVSSPLLLADAGPLLRLVVFPLGGAALRRRARGRIVIE